MMLVNKAFFAVVALASFPVLSKALGQSVFESAKSLGFRGSFFSVTESDRLKLRTKANWLTEFPGEPPEYRALQETRRREILEIPFQQERLDNFVQFAQARAVKNLTRLGYEVVSVDAALAERLKKRLHSSSDKKSQESSTPLQGIYGPRIPKFVPHGEPRLLEDLKPIMEKWSGVPLAPSVAYGMRVYERGSSLAFHTDRVETHVISGILHVDHDVNGEPWPIEIEGHDGKRKAVNLEPGQMLLYESAKCPHGRSTALEADYYASVFVHFRPLDWPYTINDVWLAVPPAWKAGATDTRGNGPRWAGAFLTHESMSVHGMPPIDEQYKKKTNNLRKRPPVPPRPDQEEEPVVLKQKKKQHVIPALDEEEEEFVFLEKNKNNNENTQPEGRRRDDPEKKIVLKKEPVVVAQEEPPKNKEENLLPPRKKAPPHKHFQHPPKRRPVAREKAPDDDDDDEATKSAASFAVGGAVVAGLLYGLGACAVLATASLVLRRACLTKGRSLVRRKHLKTDKSPL